MTIFSSSSRVSRGGLEHELQTKSLTSVSFPLTRLHRACTHCLHLVHCIELLPTPFEQTLHGYFPVFWTGPAPCLLIIILVFLVLTLRPLALNSAFHLSSFTLSSSKLSAIITRSSA